MGPDEGRWRDKLSGRVDQAGEMLQTLQHTGYWKSTLGDHSRDGVAKEQLCLGCDCSNSTGNKCQGSLAQSTSPELPLGLTQQWSATTYRASAQKTCQSAGLAKSSLTVQTVICAVSHLAKSGQTGKQILLSSSFMCCCLSAVRTGSPSRGKGKHQNCPSSSSICPMPRDLQPFYPLFSVHFVNLCAWWGYHLPWQHLHC